ncbi:hypothetical protein [Microvirga massiliensis]|uniref:hypothetical protein n=1 Tax=Microvirga massiliensis TaxID=1033741 RepID=UPI00062B851A|nr:hypothetical protein [Microvirga massiliensis]
MIRIDQEPDVLDQDRSPGPDVRFQDLAEAIDQLASVLRVERYAIIGPLARIVRKRAAFERLKDGPEDHHWHR